jgi:glyoxylase-like metal-dependent hydrolase (beta-lactamase superfamily II)
MPLKAAIVPVTPFMQNCTLLWDETSRAGAVVDPGGDIRRIRAGIEKAGMRVEKIVLTHGHIDHAGGALELKEALGGIPIEGPHRDDLFLMENLEDQGEHLGIDDVRNVTSDRWLQEGDTVAVAAATFSILHCPGHSPGSLVYVNAEQRFILMGDVLFKGSIGRTDFAYGDHDALINAIKTKLLPLGDDYAFICGHGPMSTIGEERRTNPFIA